MAVNTTPVSCDLVLVMDNGIGANGQALNKANRFANVKPGASNENLFAVAQTLSGLQDKALNVIQRRDTIEIDTI